MEVLQAVTVRLAALGYTATEADAAVLDYNIGKAEVTLKGLTNQCELPEGLFYVWVDMAVGYFLQDKKASGGLAGSTSFDTDAPIKSVKEGDVTITYAVSDGSDVDTGGLDGLIKKMVEPDGELIIKYRRLVW